MAYAKNLLNQRFGRLTVVSRNIEKQHRHFEATNQSVAFWNCLCDCGNQITVRASNLLNKTNPTLSCGCLKNEKIHMQKNTKTNVWAFEGNTAIGYTHKNEKFYIDKEDYEKAKNYCWRIDINAGYVIANSRDGSNRIVWLHRIVMGVDDETIYVDHRNWDKTDNRKTNLRLATKSENNMNIKRKTNNTSGYTGVTFNKRSGKYIARISINGNRIYLGTFDDFISAVNARHNAEIKYHKEWSGEINRKDFQNARNKQ